MKKAIGSSQELEEYENSKECNGTENSGNGKPEKKDIVECLLQKLENLKTKATACPGKPSGDQTKQTCEESTPPDDEEPLEEENPVKAPEICGDIPTTKETVVEKETCDAPVDPGKEKEKVEKESEEPLEDESGTPGPSVPPGSEPEVPPPLAPADQPLDPTILQTTIPFGIALALGSIAFFFMKVKQNIYICVVYMYIYMCFVYMYVWVCLDIYMCMCMCFIYILYICIYIDKEKNEKNEKKKKEI